MACAHRGAEDGDLGGVDDRDGREGVEGRGECCAEGGAEAEFLLLRHGAVEPATADPLGVGEVEDEHGEGVVHQLAE